ncbi:acetyltransferase [Microbacterium sp. Leaf320]|nr:acetyltransferase [Microbacterium sp. Leaf320]
MDAVSVEWSLRASSPSDAPWMAELRAIVMRPDLERLGRYDPVRVRQRFLDAFAPENTRVIVMDGEDVGLIAVRGEPDAVWIEHFYLAPGSQGRGLGSAVLADVLLERSDGDERPFRLNVLQGSAARRLYERHGFVLESEDAVDVFLKAESVRG